MLMQEGIDFLEERIKCRCPLYQRMVIAFQRHEARSRNSPGHHTFKQAPQNVTFCEPLMARSREHGVVTRAVRQSNATVVKVLKTEFPGA